MAACDNTVNEHNRGRLTFELTTTALCDMDCTYCFEGVKSNPKKLEQLDLLIERINEILESDWYKDNYESAQISFWGGEPTLNTNYIIKLMNAFKDNEKMNFHTYSNGYNLDRMKKIIEQVDTSRFNIQISYDGRAINDAFRFTNTGLTTSDQALATFDWLVKQGITTSLKSTLPGQAMGKLHECWKDFEKLHHHYKDFDNVVISFAPSIDYTQKLDEEKDDNVLNTFREQVLKIAKEEIKFYNENNRFLMSWFTGGKERKANCSAGLNFISVDVDGKTYACHGALYSQDKDKLQSSSIFDENFINNIKQFNDQFEEKINYLPDDCKDCVATTCIVCPVAIFQKSKKENTFDKWYDRGANGLCDFYQTFGEIDRSVGKYLKDLRSK